MVPQKRPILDFAILNHDEELLAQICGTQTLRQLLFDAAAWKVTGLLEQHDAQLTSGKDVHLLIPASLAEQAKPSLTS